MLFGLVSGLSYSGTIMTVSYLKTDYSGTSQLFWPSFISLLILIPFGSRISGEVLEPNLPVLIVFGIVTTAFASLLYLNSAGKIPAQTVSVLALLEPVSGIIFSSLFLHEPILMRTMQGCLLILLGALILVRDDRAIYIDNVEKQVPGFPNVASARSPYISRMTFWLFRKY